MSKRIEALEKAKELLNKWGLQACIQNAADPFVLPKMQKYRKIQLIDSSKYEVCLRMSENEDLAVASFNFHGTAFTHPFQIGIEGCKEPITGCVGFGIERWVVAFLTQFGSDEKNWPEEFRKEYYASIGEKNSD